jgi:hypothetical protein
MSKTRRRPANHGKHVDPAEIRRRNEAPAHDSPPPVTRRRRNVSASAESMLLGESAGAAAAAFSATAPAAASETAPAVGSAAAPGTGSASGPGAASSARPGGGPGAASAAGSTADEHSPAAEHPPWTTAGDYLRAAAFDEAPARFGTPPGPVDDDARRVWHTAFGLAVRRRFEPDSPLAEISRTAAIAVRAHEAAGLPAIDVEMLMRAELGEQVPVGDLDPAVVIGVHLLVFASLVDELALGDGELDDLVTQAERLAAV